MLNQYESVSRRIYLTISHHDHPDQHDVDVNAQRLVVINFIHLKKGGKSNGGKLRPSQLSSPSCAPCSHVPHPSRLSKTRCKDLIPLLPLWEGGFFLHFPICNKHEVKRPSGKKPTFPWEWLRWSMTSPISIKGCVSSTTLLNEPLPLWNMNPSEGWKCSRLSIQRKNGFLIQSFASSQSQGFPQLHQ